MHVKMNNFIDSGALNETTKNKEAPIVHLAASLVVSGQDVALGVDHRPDGLVQIEAVNFV